jgi:hypothetical protein
MSQYRIHLVATVQTLEIGTEEGLLFSGIVDADGRYRGVVTYDGNDLEFVERLLDEDDAVIAYSVDVEPEHRADVASLAINKPDGSDEMRRWIEKIAARRAM